MRFEDFPEGTQFFVTGFDVPIALYPDGKAYICSEGNPTELSDSAAEIDRFKSEEGLHSVAFAEFDNVIAESIAFKVRLAADAYPISDEDRAELEAFNAKWGCFGLGIPTHPDSVKYWLAKARAGGVPTDVYDVGKSDDDD